MAYFKNPFEYLENTRKAFCAIQRQQIVVRTGYTEREEDWKWDNSELICFRFSYIHEQIVSLANEWLKVKQYKCLNTQEQIVLDSSLQWMSFEVILFLYLYLRAKKIDHIVTKARSYCI